MHIEHPHETARLNELCERISLRQTSETDEEREQRAFQAREMATYRKRKWRSDKLKEMIAAHWRGDFETRDMIIRELENGK